MMLPTPYKASLTVYPYRENYLILPTELMMRGSGIQRKAILITSDIPINGEPIFTIFAVYFVFSRFAHVQPIGSGCLSMHCNIWIDPNVTEFPN